MKLLSGCLKVVVGVVGFFFVFGVIVHFAGTYGPRVDGGATSQQGLTAATPEEQKAQAAAFRRRECLDWCIQTSVDDISGKPVLTATLASATTLNFAFPYQGEQRARITVRKHPRFGHDVILSLEKGQIPCTLGCTTTVRIGETGNARSWRMSAPSDHNATNVFFQRSEEFERLARGAREIAIEFTAFQEGNPSVIFRPMNDLVWPQ